MRLPGFHPILIQSNRNCTVIHFVKLYLTCDNQIDQYPVFSSVSPRCTPWTNSKNAKNTIFDTKIQIIPASATF